MEKLSTYLNSSRDGEQDGTLLFPLQVYLVEI